MVLLLSILKNNYILATAIGLASLLCSCATTYFPDSLSDSQKVDQMELDGYDTLAPMSVEFMEYMEGTQQDTIMSIIQGVRKNMGDSQALTKYLNHQEMVYRSLDRNTDTEWTQFKSCLRKGDSIYFFKYTDNSYQDFGLLVLRDGKVCYRSVWGWSIINTKGATVQQPYNMNFERW